MTRLFLPDPSLVLLIGAAGSGKSTFAARHFDPAEVLSSDAFRALVSGDEANQEASGVAFRILHRELQRRVAAGQLTVVDATNATPRNRRELIARARAAGLATVAIVLALPPMVVRARNATRRRRVPDDVVTAQLERVRRTIRPGALEGEGCAMVWIGRTPESVDAVTIERLPSGGTRSAGTRRPRRDERHRDRRKRDADRMAPTDPLAEDQRGQDRGGDGVERGQRGRDGQLTGLAGGNEERVAGHVEEPDQQDSRNE